jgi:hypothetical protein
LPIPIVPLPSPMPNIPMPIPIGVEASMLLGVRLPLATRSPLPGEMADDDDDDDAWDEDDEDVEEDRLLGSATRRPASADGGADDDDDAADCATVGVIDIIGVPAPPSQVLPPLYIEPGRLKPGHGKTITIISSASAIPNVNRTKRQIIKEPKSIQQGQQRTKREKQKTTHWCCPR